MGKSLIVGAVALLSVFFLTSCGPEKSARDREMEQLDRTVQKNKSNNDQIAGWYLGKFDFIRAAPGTSVKTQDVCVYVYSSVAFVDMPARGEKLQIPVMGAYIFLKGGLSTYYFSSSIYDVDEGIARFTGTSLFMEVRVNGSIISGDVYSVNLVSAINARRVTKEVCTAAVF